MNKDDRYYEINGEKKLMYSGYYKCYTAEYCKYTGKPMLNSDTYRPYSDKWLSPTRCKFIEHPVIENEEIVAFYRVVNGYCPLYDREEYINEWK